MNALIFEKYGPPEKVLTLKDVVRPTPGDKEILIKIISTAVNDYDWSMVRGKPYLYRLLFGLFKPKHKIMGMEVAGIVEAVGPNARKFKAGDAVFGDTSAHGFGTFAEYICIHENAVIKKPDELSFDEAAAIPHASLLALQAFRDIGGISQGQKILINGGGGGVGTIGLQLAKLHNCEVTGVDSGEKLDMMRSIGFDHVIDYKKVDFTKTGEQYDVILDCKTTRPAFAYPKVLKRNGKYVTIGGKLVHLLSMAFLSKVIPFFSSKRIQILSLKPNEGLESIADLCRQNKIKCMIDGPYPLKDLPMLIQYFGEGRHKGKIVVNIKRLT